jgi:hypothetical protein
MESDTENILQAIGDSITIFLMNKMETKRTKESMKQKLSSLRRKTRLQSLIQNK